MTWLTNNYGENMIRMIKKITKSSFTAKLPIAVVTSVGLLAGCSVAANTSANSNTANSAASPALKNDSNSEIGVVTWLLKGDQGRDGVRRNIPMPDGGFILSGWTEGGATRKDGKAWILRTDSQGNIVWKNVHPNMLGNNRGSHIGAHTINADGDLIYTLEEFRSKNGKPPGITGRSTLHKATLEGQIISKKIVGGAGTDIIDIMIPQPDGTIVMGGETTSPDGKSYQGWIFKVDSDFNVIWDKKVGGYGYERFNGLIRTADGGFLAIGRTSGGLGRYRGKLWKFDSTGNIVWEKRYREDEYYASSLREAVELPNGAGFIFAGWVINDSEENPRDIWLARITAGGSMMWSQTLGGLGDDIAFALVQTGDGTFVAAGQSEQDNQHHSDAIAIGFDVNGNILWQKHHGQAAVKDVIRGAIPYQQNGYMLTGNAENTETGEHDALVIMVEDIDNLIKDK